MTFRVIETSEWDVEAESAEEANALVRDGVSHSDELIAATSQFFVSGRTVDGQEID